MKIIDDFDDASMRDDDKHNYIRYRLGRLKHQLWLENRKNKNKFVIDEYDHFIVRNLRPGNTCAFGSAGYYLDEVIEDLTVVEQWPIVKKFYPKCHIITDRSEISYLGKFDNFIVNNNRGDLWETAEGLTKHVMHYTNAMAVGCLFFYSFRDTQIHYNRLTLDHNDYFLSWAHGLTNMGLNLLWHDIKFAVKVKDGEGNYDGFENPDTTNGNIKFVFQFKQDDAVIK